MTQTTDDATTECAACAAPGPDQLVWDDELWTLSHADGQLVLTLRDHEDLGQLDDDMASQLGRITNRLVRIMEGQPEAGRAALRRADGPHLQVLVSAAQVPDLHRVATKLANWGGEARA